MYATVLAVVLVLGQGAAEQDDLLQVFIVPHSHCDVGKFKIEILQKSLF
jgi:hypothetical protein